MKVIYLERGKGKTTKLLELSAKTGYIIVCISKARCNILIDSAKTLNLEMPEPVDYYSVKDYKIRNNNIKGILIDDCDEILTHIFGDIHIEAVTFTRDLEHTRELKLKGLKDVSDI